jgi:putative spermidine/putrescine transport system permease protein
VCAEPPPHVRDPLHGSHPDRSREDPEDGGRRRGPRAHQHVDDDGLGALRHATHEVQRPIVAALATAALGDRRPRQERNAGDVIGAEEHDRGEARRGMGDGDAHDEPCVDREVRDEVEIAPEICRTDPTSDCTIEPVGGSVDQPQTQRQPAMIECDRHAGTDADHEPERGDLPRSQPRRSGTRRQRAQRRISERPQPTIEHAQTTRSRDGIPLGALPALVVVIVLLGGAVVGLIMDSVRPGAITGGSFGLAAWRSVLDDHEFTRAVWFTTQIAAVTTIVASTCALGLAIALRPRARWLRSAVAVPIPVPHLVAASMTIAWFAPGGLAERLLGGVPFAIVGDRHGIGVVVVYLFKEIPFLTLLVLASFDQHTVDLEQAAAGLGAGRYHRLRDIVLPRVGPPLAAGALVVSAFVLGATEVPLLVGPGRPDTVATYALDTVRVNGPVARAQSAAALTFVMLLMLIAAAVATITHRAARAGRGRP